MPGEELVIYQAAGGVVLRGEEGAEPEILLLERPGRGEVRLPKGHIDRGETPREAALRETAEESGFGDLEVVADLGEAVVTFRHQGCWVQRHEHYYLMRLRSPQPFPRSPVDEAQFIASWVPLAQAASMLTFEPEQQRIEQARRYLQK
jgi:8-oxo-dGTP pyrophosphatase MutT (NUDIX family)